MRRTRLSLASLVLLCAPAPIFAQEAAQAFGEITVLASTNFAKSSDLQFGVHNAIEGVISIGCSGCTPARFDGLGVAGRLVDIAFQLPSVLQRVGNTATVPITYGSDAAAFQADGGTVVRFNPATGLAGAQLTPSGTGGFAVWLGGPGAPANAAQDVQVNITGAGGGTYRGVITATIIQH